MSAGLVLGLVLCVCLGLAFCVLFWFSLDYFVLVLFVFAVLGLVFLCPVGCKTLTQSINQLTSLDVKCNG